MYRISNELYTRIIDIDYLFNICFSRSSEQNCRSNVLKGKLKMKKINKIKRKI